MCLIHRPYTNRSIVGVRLIPREDAFYRTLCAMHMRSNAYNILKTVSVVINIIIQYYYCYLFITYLFLHYKKNTVLNYGRNSDFNYL